MNVEQWMTAGSWLLLAGSQLQLALTQRKQAKTLAMQRDGWLTPLLELIEAQSQRLEAQSQRLDALEQRQHTLGKIQLVQSQRLAIGTARADLHSRQLGLRSMPSNEKAQ